jgi:hypothetical protein
MVRRRMRPNKSGKYWWLNNKGKFEIAVVYVDEDESDPSDYLSDMVSHMSLRELENTPRFKRWIGPVYPPQNIRSFITDVENLHVPGYERKRVVLYDDVKKYDLRKYN